MKRGDIYFANLDPTIGSEIQKTRPVLIVSNNANNNASAIVTVVPITSNITKIYPFEVLLDVKQTGLLKQSKAQCNQIRTISKNRINTNRTIGNIGEKIMKNIEHAIKLHLDLI